jgi:phosphotriesterase-related protein
MCWSDWFPNMEARQRLLPDHNYLYVLQKVVPALLKEGVTQGQIDKMLIDNPRRHFEGTAERFAAKQKKTA